ncbi:MAG TPA: VCBS repeat-containing protein, partial [Pyrinomonadaceae bacterium]
DGDGRTDIAVWRGGPPNQAAFYILQSKTSTVRVELFGQNGDRPTTVRDYDGDGKADVSVYRPGVNPGDQSYFFYRGSLNNPSGNITYVRWGANGDTETQGDFDGDGKGDFCVRRNIGGAAWFYLLKSSGGIEYINWGLPGDGIVPCDFDGDGRSDFCVARVDANSNYNTYVRTRSGGGTGASPIVFGSALLGDKAAFGDYDGDGKTDVGIWRADPDPSKDVFWIRLTANHSVIARRWGLPDDRSLAEWDTTGGE